MMMNIRNKRLAIAVAGSVGLLASTAQAADFTASTTLQNTLAVTVVNDFDIGTVFATKTGGSLILGVGALVIKASDGSVSDHPTDSVGDPTTGATLGDGVVNLTSLTAPTLAQGTVEMGGDFTLSLPNTSTILPADFEKNTGASLIKITDGTGNATELVHVSGDPQVPSLYLMHFTVASENADATVTADTSNNGTFPVAQTFGKTLFTFNIGATLTTKPTAAEETYQEGIYSGTFEVTAAY